VVKQLERAAELTENATKVDVNDRGLQTEEEICLYYRVLLANGSKADFIKRVQCPKLGALAQLEKGHKLLFWESLKALETWGEWDLIYNLCRQALRMGLEGVTTPFFVCDWLVWKRFITAASKSATSERFVTAFLGRKKSTDSRQRTRRGPDHTPKILGP